MSKTLYMETTSIPPEKTAGEIMGKLVSAGARQIVMDYDAAAEPVGVRFVIPRGEMMLQFSLPARTEPVCEYLLKRRAKANRNTGLTEDQKQAIRVQGKRVAWRQLLRWIESQLAMIETGMVSTEEVFFPYMQQQNGQTLFEVFREQQFKALAAPKEPAC